GLELRRSPEFLRVVDVTNGNERILKGHRAGVTCLAFSPDSKTLATGSDDMSVRLWDFENGEDQFTTLQGHVDGISAVGFVSDGSFLVTGSQDGVVKCWDLAAIHEKNVLDGNGGWILALAFSPDGTTLAAASTGEKGANINSLGEVKLWDVASSREL